MVQFIVDFNDTHVFQYVNVDIILVLQDIKKELSVSEKIPCDLISIIYDKSNDVEAFDETTIIFLRASLIDGLVGGKGGIIDCLSLKEYTNYMPNIAGNKRIRCYQRMLSYYSFFHDRIWCSIKSSCKTKSSKADN